MNNHKTIHILNHSKTITVITEETILQTTSMVKQTIHKMSLLSVRFHNIGKRLWCIFQEIQHSYSYIINAPHHNNSFFQNLVTKISYLKEKIHLTDIGICAKQSKLKL